MFQTIKQQIDLVELISRDTGLIFKESGLNYVIDEDKDTEGCPFCGHHDSFRIRHTVGENETSFYKCFSCNEHGDVIKWAEKRYNLSPRDAALKLAKEFGIQLPHNYSPIQEIFNLSANYYQTCLHDSCNIPYKELNGLTPLEYQNQIRCHTTDTLTHFNVGWSDGGLVDYLRGIGFDDELIADSGLMSKKGDRDFLPSKCFIYPHYVGGKVSHFTFKDPTKRVSYQLAKKHSLNGYMFYNQDSVQATSTIIIVEGENDLISTWATGKAPAIVATIGQLSGEQLDWLRNNCADKNIVTIFDPDDAGNKYRVKVEKNRKFFKGMVHILPPDGKDIDELLSGGADIEDIARNNQVKVVAEEDPAEAPSLPVDFGSPDVSKLKETLASNGLAAPAQSTGSERAEDDDEEVSHGGVVQSGGIYSRVVFKDGVPDYVPISDFIMKLKNVYLSEDGDRYREVVVVRNTGYTSDPFLVNSDTKVNEKPFCVLMAKVADATYTGNKRDLADIWKIVSKQAPDVLVKVPRTVGRIEKNRGYLFRNAFISDTGVVTQPDSDGIFWLHGKSIGIRPESLNQRSTIDSDRKDIPSILLDLSRSEADDIMRGVIVNLSRNLTGPGLALTALGWTRMCLSADHIFSLNKGVPQLFLWGVNGKGKTTVAKWLQDFYGMRDHGSTSIPNLKTGVGWARKSEYYSCLPLMIDEVRSNDETRQYLGTFRSYYDREGRTMGTQDGFGVRTTAVRSTFIFVGEDQFDDPATRERCIPLRIPANGRETVETYRWMEDHRHLFTGVTYHWILDAASEDPEKLTARIRALDKELVSAGCPQRVSKNWAAIGVFGIELAEKYLPEFDFKEYLIKACQHESQTQRNDTTLMQFWELVENIMAKENSPINGNHIMVDDGDKHLHIWYPYVFKAVQDDQRGKLPFSKNAILSAIKEEPYYLRDDLRKQLGISGTRPRVLTLDMEKAPEVLRNIAKAN